MPHQRSLALGFVLALVAGCTGTIGESKGHPGSNGAPTSGPTGSGSTGSGSTGSGSTGTGAGGSTGTGGPLTQPVASMHKLTVVEFTNSLHDLLGNGAPVASQLEPDQQVNGFRSISGAVVAVSSTGVAQFETAINAATQFAFSSATQAATVLSCVPTSATDPQCSISQVLGNFGRRAFRRPLTT